jgi:exonuclease III
MLMAASNCFCTTSTVTVYNSVAHRLIVVSYNLHGFNQGFPGIRDMISDLSPDVFMIQEHWLTPDNLHKLSDISNDYFVFGSSAMSACVSAGPLRGRPFGGTALLIKKKHASATLNIVSVDRFTAVSLANYLLISVYMPCSGTDQRILLYTDVMHKLQALIDSHPSMII